MTWMSIGIGVASFVALALMTRRLRPVGADASATALRVLGGGGLAALAGLAMDGSPAAAAVAAVAATALIVDVRLLGRAVTGRVRARHASTVTPFQNAT